MSNVLLEIENEVLLEGREWTRQALEKRWQESANSIAAICPQTGVLLKDPRKCVFTLMSVAGTITIEAVRGRSSATGQWHCPVREAWGLEAHARLSPELEKRLSHNAGATGSYEKAAELATVWGSPISDDTIHAVVQRLGKKIEQAGPDGFAPPEPIKANEPAFSLVIMLDGWMVRQRGPGWGLSPRPDELKAIDWKEVKSAIIYRLEDRASNASGRGVIIEKKVVAVPPNSDVVELGAMIQAQAMRAGLARAREVFVVADGAVWIWNLVKDRFGDAIQSLDFFHASQHLWSLAKHLHAGNKEAAAAWVTPILRKLRHESQHRVVENLEELLLTNFGDAEVEKEVGYFQRNCERMNYKELADRDVPIGSGAMESACSQFQNRLKRRGQFWSPDGLSNLLAVDVALKNDDLKFCWN